MRDLYIRVFGETLDERITNLIACILCAMLPLLLVGAIAGMPVPQ